MQQLFAFGVNHHTAPLDVREQVTFGPEVLDRALRDLVEHEPVKEAAILSTCNRTEVYCNTSEPYRVVDWLARFHRLRSGALEPFIYRLSREHAVQHAFRVASGLDSMVLGEPQILGQMKDAVKSAEQAGTLGYVNGTAFTHGPVEELAAELARLSPGALELVYPLGSGSEAVEAALKLARQYWVEIGRSAKRTIVALAPSYHGNTLLALSASARPHYSALFGGWLVEVVRAPAPYAYRCECRGNPPYCPACSGAAIEEAIVRTGPDAVAAVIAAAERGAG